MGEHFLTFPNTRLGLLVRNFIFLLQEKLMGPWFQVKCSDKKEILKLCDKYFEGEVPEFYFDR